MLGIKIKEYLLSKGIKQTHLSKAANISLCRLNQILNGIACMKATEYISICLALEISCDTFAGVSYNANYQ